MKLTTWQTATLIGAASYLICILAQSLPLGLPIQPFPTDLYNRIELIGFVSGVVGVYLVIKQSPLNYPVGLIWAIAYAYYFFAEAKQYGDVFVMLVTAGYLIDGWIKWSSNPLPSGEGLREGNSASLPITDIQPKNWIIIGLTPLIFIPLLATILQAVKGQFVWIDAATTMFGLLAQYLTNRKIFQSWHFWIITNLIYIPLFFYRQYYPTAILYIIFLIMAFVGMAQWRASMNQTNPS